MFAQLIQISFYEYFVPQSSVLSEGRLTTIGNLLDFFDDVFLRNSWVEVLDFFGLTVHKELGEVPRHLSRLLFALIEQTALTSQVPE